MDCILNGVKLPAVKSSNNILFVDHYKEEFFDIYNVEINGKSFIAEFLENTKTGPLVKIKDFTLGENVYHDVTFLLVKEKAEVRVHLNESNVTKANYTPVPKLVYHIPAKIEAIINEKKQTPVDISVQKELIKLKEQALNDIEKEKQQLSLIKEQTENVNEALESKLDEYKTKLLEHFYQVVEENKDTFTNIAEKKLNDIVEELKRLNNDTIVESSSTIINEQTQKLITLFEQEKNNILNSVLEKASKDVQELVSDIDIKLEANFKLSAKELTDKASISSKAILESNEDAFKKINENFTNTLNESQTNLTDHFYKIADQAKQNFEKTSTALINEAIANIKVENDKTFSEESKKVIQEKTAELQKLVEESKTDLSYQISEKLSVYWNDLNKKTENSIIDTTKNLVESTKNDFDVKFNEFTNKVEIDFKNKVNEFLAEKNNLYDHVTHKIVDSTDNLHTFVSDKLDKASNKLIQDSKILFEDGYKILSERVTESVLKIDNSISQIETEKNNFIQKVEIEIKERVSEGIDNINENISRIEKEKNEFIEYLDNEIKQTLKNLPENVNTSLNKDETFISEVYSRFSKEHGSKIEEAVERLFKEKEETNSTDKFTNFKQPKIDQKFVQMVQSEWNKKETELIRKVKKIVLDFYYTWGSGGGSVAVQYAAGGTIDGNLNVTGNILSAGQNLFTVLSATGGGGGPTQTPYSVFARSSLTGVSAVIDYFELSAFNSAKYNIQVLSGNDVYSSTIAILGNTTVAKYTEYAVLYTTTSPFIGYAVRSTGGYLELIITTTSDLYNMIVKGVRLDPILQ